VQPLPSSYRDNDGFVFEKEGQVYRHIHPRYETHYSTLMKSGLYDELVKKKWLIPHTGIDNTGVSPLTGRVIHPEQIPFISYPYEWSFDMWKDAALLTLRIAASSLQKGMILKDATPFNIQFYKGRPVFIDTLSFENYQAGKPWVAYRQFTECFLGPLLLMHYCHPDTNKLFVVYPNGIPVDVLVSLLPKKSKWNINTLMHVHLQAKFSGKSKQKTGTGNNFSQQKLQLLLKGLESFVQKLSLKKIKTTWDDYYTDTILGEAYLKAKTTLVQSFISQTDFKTVIDLGANDGHFSLLFNNDKKVIATDFDSNCINELYLNIKKSGCDNILPLVNNLTTPSPAIGWNNAERESFTTRLKADMVMALALVHHLAIANNVPLNLIVNWLKPMGELLIIEFVPRSDEKVKLLLQNREDIFDSYSLENFKSIFTQNYNIVKEEQIADTGRILFLMKRK
jgi:ribosomal protein L11 methylase PrmA